MDFKILVILFIEEVLAFFFLYYSGFLKNLKECLISALLIVVAFSIRIYFFDYQTADYSGFLSKWVEYYRNNGGFAAMKDSVGNYNIPYLYFLALFSYSGISDLYLIKGLSVFFDVVLAAASCLIIHKLTYDDKKSVLGFFIVLFLPTVIINGSLWAQCDSIYVAFALLGIYLALVDKPYLSMICIAVSFGFKLQAVFIMPVYIILMQLKKLKLKHFLIFPVTYFILVLPAILLGRPIRDAVMLYADQASSVGSALNYNSPSLTALINSNNVSSSFAAVCIILAFAAMFIVLLISMLCGKRLNGDAFICLAAMMVTVIPFLLPHMHDRYFFASDVMTVIAAICVLFCIPSAVLTQFASLVCYIAYLKTYYVRFGTIYLTNGRGAVAIIASFLFLILGFIYAIFLKDKKAS